MMNNPVFINQNKEEFKYERLNIYCAGSSQSKENKCLLSIRRLIEALSALDEPGFLGWQFSINDEGIESYAFSGKGNDVSPEDFNWIFKDCASVVSDEEPDDNSNTEDIKNAYAIIEKQTADQHSEKPCYSESFSDITQIIKDSRAAFRLIAFKESESSDVKTAVIIFMSGSISLRMKAVLSIVFPNTGIKAIDNSIDFSEAYSVDNSKVINGCAHILKELTNLSEGALLNNSLNSIFFPDNELCSASIEELGLSLRSLNCLLRAGVNSIASLQQISDEELHSIRNLGQKNISEIKEKLEKYLAQKEEDNKNAESTDYMAQLSELIGLQNVKEQVEKIRALARMKKEMNSANPDALPIVLNMEFIGNPGTAKTSVARILSGIFHEEGLIKESGIIEVGRADLVGEYLGQTASKVKAVFQKAKGRLLFIDEAYSLLEGYNGYGDEAINTIVQELDNNCRDTIVIFAGYPKETEQMFSRNPGLKSRVPFKLEFSDYSESELLEISKLIAEKMGFEIKKNAYEKIALICSEAKQSSDFGNGRFCRNLVDSAVLSFAYRNFKEDGNKSEFILEECDFEYNIKNAEERKIGF